MKNWWLKLYTIPALKKLLLFSCMCIGLDVLGTLGGHSANALMSLVYLAPIVFLIGIENHRGFVANLAFHKTTLPFHEIQKAFLKHYSILVSTSLFSGLFLSFLSEQVGGAAKSLFFVPKFSTLILMVFAVIFASTIMLVFTKSFSHITMRFKKGNFILNAILGIIYPLLAFCVLVLMIWGGMSGDVALWVLGIALISASAVYNWRGMFHNVPKQASRWMVFKYSGISVASYCVFFLVLAFIGRNDHLDIDLTPQERALSLMNWQPVSGKIDLSTFTDLEPHIDIAEMELFYTLAPSNVGELPIQNFIDSKNVWRVIAFIRYGKPSQKNLLFLAEHLQRNKDKWNKIDPGQRVANNLAFHWPKHYPAPESVTQYKVKRAVASDKKVEK